jgi:hypothetical protein
MLPVILRLTTVRMHAANRFLYRLGCGGTISDMAWVCRIGLPLPLVLRCVHAWLIFCRMARPHRIA